ncbi:Uncharacterised protein [Chromobacterium violaceum]|uniref:Uncharacterized protein n=1 Tax=Chromobacterium violaceum TaxID=536 RepID=A0A447TEY4_CHRVL|nr:Uncharacterised protein [Chromobacterium violaceum]
MSAVSIPLFAALLLDALPALAAPAMAGRTGRRS